MSHTNTVLLIVFLVMSAFALVPMLARSWRMFFILATATGLFVGFFWVQAFTVDWDKDRMAAGFVALVATSGWTVGLGGAILRLVGRRRGWWVARFPATEAFAIGVVLTLFFVWLRVR